MTKDHDALRLAVVGLRHGIEHTDVIDRRPDTVVAAVCDLDPARCKRFTGRRDVAIHQDYQRMLAETALDGVVIATPLALHGEMAVAALQRDLHVLLEKPFTVTMEEARSVQAAGQKSQGICQIGYEMRSSPLMLKVKEVLTSGALGRVVLLWANMFRGGSESQWRNDRATCGGVFFDCFVHEINELLCWADADFERVAAFGAPVGEKGRCADVSPETVVGCMEFDNAIRASVCFSSVSQTTDNTHFGVVGVDGRIDGNPWRPAGAGSLRIYTHDGLFRTEVVIDGKKASTGHLGFAEQYDFFVRGARDGTALICDVDDAIRTQRAMKAFDRALAEGRVVQRREIE